MARRGRDKPNPRDPDGLTDRQLAFIDHYLGDCRFNASKAARAAGYAVRQSAAELMAMPVIRARIDAELAALTATRDEVLTMLHDDATLDIDEVLGRNGLNDPIVKSATVSALMSARTTARGTLAKAYGLLSDRVHAGGGITIRIEGVDEEAL